MRRIRDRKAVSVKCPSTPLKSFHSDLNLLEAVVKSRTADLFHNVSYKDLRRFDDIVHTMLTALKHKPAVHGATSAQVNSLQSVKLADRRADDCAICTEPFTGTKAIVRMECTHEYHALCLEHWLKMKNSCPVCRREIPSEDVPSIPKP